jgi:radical SAM superfamily enzyme YgiQ (UPF0313 family)
MKKFFITDDNFARNQNWEAIFDRIIRLRQREGFKLRFIIQVDTLCHKIPNFVAKAGEAGVNRVFIGLETLNSANLASAKKGQNAISEYRAMLQAWKTVGAITSCGYIIGFPNDTKESVLREIETMKRELPIDLVEFFCLDQGRVDGSGLEPVRQRTRDDGSPIDVRGRVVGDLPARLGYLLHHGAR